MKRKLLLVLAAPLISVMAFTVARNLQWDSKFVQADKKGNLTYTSDEKGNIIPDFSRVGYYQGDKAIPEVPVAATISPSADAAQKVQAAINALAAKAPDKNGFRGAILLKKGTYQVSTSLVINAGGIVLRGEGDTENGTKLVASFYAQKPLIVIAGSGTPQTAGSRIKVTDSYVPVGSFSFSVSDAKDFRVGDAIILNRPGTDKWIEDTKMNQIEERGGTKQWKASEYNLEFERTITKIEGNKIFIDNPVMQALDVQYGGGEIYKYAFTGRIREVGVENLYMESVYTSDTAENHAWDAININKAEQGWVRNVTSRYFGNACVNLGDDARYITVTDSKCFDAKSVITGGRRYSFSNNGQCNLFMNCHTTEGRHDFVTGSKTLGPNVFYNCTAKKTHADIGPHHRWAVGTLYDNIVTDGEINVQDRGNWGSGHGWAGVTQVLWNCTVKRAAVQSPWASGKNYNIGMKGDKYDGRLKGRPDGEWEGQNKAGLQPASLYMAQLKARKKGADVNVKDYGATGDGTTLDSKAIQRAIDACAQQGGGKVIFPAGKYLSGTIVIKDNITLLLQKDALILGSTNINDYDNIDPFTDGLGIDVGWALLVAVDAKNIGIEGEGAIDGQGAKLKAAHVLTDTRGESKIWGRRPFLLRVVRCTGVTVRGVSLYYAAAWTSHYFQSKQILIEHVKIVSHGVAHNDGMDIDGCQQVQIRDCDVESGDDALCFKTTSSAMGCKDIAITRMRLKSNQAAIKMGTESMAPFENIDITHCEIYDTRNGGIKLLTVDGAHLRNVTISDITMKNVRTPLLLRLGSRLNVFRKGKDTQQPTGTFENVVIRNVKAEAAADAQLKPPSGILITGVPGHYISNVTLENIEISLAGGGTAANARHAVPEAIDQYPEVKTFGPLIPAWGIWARHVKGLKLKHIRFNLAAEDLRPAFIAEDAQDIELTDWKVPAAAAAESIVRLENVQGAKINHFTVTGRAVSFVKTEGGSKDIKEGKVKYLKK